MTKLFEIIYNTSGDRMRYGRKMGLDYGDRRIGIAFSDLLGVIASAYDVYKNVDQDSSIKYLTKLAKEKEVDEIIIGLPLNMQGEENERTLVTREFGKKLSDFSGISVVYEDERLTSVEADEILKEAGMNWEKRKELVDKVSAELILQSYLNNKK